VSEPEGVDAPASEQPEPGLLVAVAQFGPGPNPAENVETIANLVTAAAANGARLMVLPEYSAAFAGALDSWVSAVAEPLTGPFVTALAELAREHQIAIVAGMLEASSNPADPRPFNTVFAVTAEHGLVARYRKLHLYDAYGSSESTWITPGDPRDAAQTFVIDDLTVGLQTCYDLRFPEVTRRLVDAGVQLVAMPSQWLAGPRKAHHWVALAAARAIENLVFVAAANQVGPAAVGLSRIVSPLGETLIDTGQATGVSLARVDPAAVAAAREVNPALANRRFGVHPLD
jgi:predicted amidohydrolase